MTDEKDTPFLPTFLAAPTFTSGGALVDEIVAKLGQRMKRKQPPLLLTQKIEEPVE